MSAYIVEKRCIDRCVSAIMSGDHSDIICKITPALVRKLHKAGADAHTVLGRALYQMNAAAVAYRYNEKPERKHAQTYRFNAPSIDTRPVDLFKSLDCFTYQCAEGDVYKRPLFRLCEAVQQHIAARMVRETPEYDRAVWG